MIMGRKAARLFLIADLTVSVFALALSSALVIPTEGHAAQVEVTGKDDTTLALASITPTPNITVPARVSIAGVSAAPLLRDPVENYTLHGDTVTFSRQLGAEVTFLTAPVRCITLENGVTEVRNDRYVARFTDQGAGFSVRRLGVGGIEGANAVSGEQVRISYPSYPLLSSSYTNDNLYDRQVSVEKCYDFYARISVSGRLPLSSGSLVLTRTYEFLQSSNIYEQIELRLASGLTTLPLQLFSWNLNVDSNMRVAVYSTTDDFMVQMPDGLLGGLSKSLKGRQARSVPQKSGAASWRRVIVSQRQLTDGSAADLAPCNVLLSNLVISINAQTEPGLDFSTWPYVDYQFYPKFGLRAAGGEAGTFTFTQWNSYKYAMEGIVPIPPAEVNRQTGDYLIRYTMHMVERLASDKGWFTQWAWGDEGTPGYPKYPRGDRFTANSRSYPALAYVWAYLTFRRTPSGWIHIPGNADIIYNQLQETYRFYIESDPHANFADRSSETGTPYLSYSSEEKEKNICSEAERGVLNTHGHALHFAWLMQEASHLYGDKVREGEWADVVARYHQGSKEMFKELYPGKEPLWGDQPTEDQPTYLGLISYSRTQPMIAPDTNHLHIGYSSISFESIAAGYLNAMEYEPEFADAVERASRLDLDPFDSILQPVPEASYVARLYRVFPAALSFAMSEEALPRHFQDSRWDTWDTYPEMKVLAGDFNGDGKTDVMKFDVAQDSSISQLGLWVGLSDGAKFNSSEWTRWDTYPEMKVLTGDFDGDGKTDVMKFDVAQDGRIAQLGLWVGLSRQRPDGTWYFEGSEWARWDTYPEMKVLTGDFDGDGKTDVMKFDVAQDGRIAQLGLWVGLSRQRPDGTWYFESSEWARWDTYPEMKVLTGDFNGDGKTDVMKFDVAQDGRIAQLGLWVGLSDGTKFNTGEWARWDTYPEMKVLAGDFNGDGKTDVMKFDVAQDGSTSQLGLWVGLSDGTKFNTGEWARWDTYPEMKVLAGDFNGDGKTDVMKFDVAPSGSIAKGGLWVGISNGRSFDTTIWSRWDTYPEMMVYAGDFDGDGDSDVMKFDAAQDGSISQLGLWVGRSEEFPFDGPDMSRDLSAASLTEVLGYDWHRPRTVHDPAKFIVEGGGRKWIITNTRFKTYWSPGFWEEVAPAEVPRSAWFAVRMSVPPDQTMGHYTAYRVSNRIEIMTDFSGGKMTLELPGPNIRYSLDLYTYQNGRWEDQPTRVVSARRVTAPGTDNVQIELGELTRKTLAIVTILP
jgi:hypothetical protein